MEAKTTKYHSKAISDAEAQTTFQAMMFQEEHSNYLWGLEEQALGEEGRSCQDGLSSCQATLSHSPQSIRGTGCIIPFTIGTSTSITFTRPVPKDPSCGRTAILSHSSHTNAKTISKTKKATSFARVDGEHTPGWSHPSSCGGRTSLPQEVRNPSSGSNH